jgi:photosystem II stability/assembly factor-like uncharacterized protein
MGNSTYFKPIADNLKLFWLSAITLLLFVDQTFPQNNTWEKVGSSGLYSIDQFSINSKGDIFACFQNQMIRSTNNGNSWTTIRTNQNPFASTLAAIGSNDNLFATDFGAILKSSDKGDTWVTYALPVSFIHTVRLSPDGYIFVGANGNNCRSKDNGNHWETIPLIQAKDFVCLKNGIILAGVNDGNWAPVPKQYIYRSTDNGDSWQKVLDADSTFGWSMAVSSNGNVFASALESSGTRGGVYRSTDSGINWSRVNNGLPTRKVNSLVITSTGKLFASIQGSGVFQSVDNGDTWISFNNGLDNLQTRCLAMDSANNIYLGTTTTDTIVKAAIYRLTLPTSVNEKSLPFPNAFILSQNYPNPFNPSTSISFNLPTRLFVTLKVFDCLGREISTLISGELNAGAHIKQWNATDMPSGIYYYRISAGDFIQTKKFVLIK